MLPQIPDRLVPPQNVEAEELILGGILFDPRAMGRVADLIIPEAFYLEAHREVFRAMSILFAQGKPTDPMTVSAYLGDHHKLEAIGGISRLAQFIERTVSAANIDRYAAIVMDKYFRRRLINAGREIVDLGFDTTTELDTVLEESEQKVYELSQKRPQRGSVPISEPLCDTFIRLEMLQQKLIKPGTASGFYDLDSMTAGFNSGDLIILAARPAMGKTAFATAIAHHIAAKEGKASVIFSLEMSKEQIAQRMLSSEAKIDSNRLRSGDLSEDEFTRITECLGTLSELPIYIDDSANITVSSIRTELRRLQSEKKLDIGVVVIDYLQLMEGSGDNRVQELSKITRSLKLLAKDCKVPIIVLSQLNRGVEGRNNKRPMMADLRESGSIEQDSDLILMLYRDEYYNPDTPDRGVAELIIAKHRNGATGTVKLLFKPEFTQFVNMEKRVNY